MSTAVRAVTVLSIATIGMTSSLQPTLFISHGGGPMPFLNDPGHRGLVAHWQKLSATIGRPRAILVVSAHWEESKATVTSSAKPNLLYDYYGFPPETYEIKYPAPGEPALARRVQELLSAAGIANAADEKRGLDHGVFIPLKGIFPAADIPVVQLSLLSSLDPEKLIAMGRAIAPLRNEGVLIVGSGFSFHNMHAFFNSGSGPLQWSRAFNQFLVDACTKETGEARDAKLSSWSAAPHAKFVPCCIFEDCHPREEHLAPLFVVAAAAGGAPGRIIFQDLVLGVEAVDLQFGALPECS